MALVVAGGTWQEQKYSEQYAHFKDFVGHDKTDQEARAICDALYLKDPNYSFFLVDEKGRWRTKPARGNEDRFNMAAAQSRKKSVERIGLVVGIRAPPWLCEADEGDDLLQILAWAHLLGPVLAECA